MTLKRRSGSARRIMKKTMWPTGRLAVVPENELDESILIELMAALAPTPEDKTRLLNKAIYAEEGHFVCYDSDRFYHLEPLPSGRFKLHCSDE